MALNANIRLVSLMRIVNKITNNLQDNIRVEEFVCFNSLETVIESCAQKTGLPTCVIAAMLDPHYPESVIEEQLEYMIKNKGIYDPRILVNHKVAELFRPGPHQMRSNAKETFAQLSEEDILLILSGEEGRAGVGELSTALRFASLAGLHDADFSYWDIRKDLEDNFKAMGWSDNFLMSLLVKLSRKVFGTDGFLGEMFDTKRIANIIDKKHIVTYIDHGFNEVAVKSSSRLKGYPLAVSLEACWNLLLPDIIVDEDGDGCSGYGFIYTLYLMHYKQWVNSETVVNVLGEDIYIHHHTVFERLDNDEYEREHYHISNFSLPLPNSIKDHPKDVLKEYIEKLAIEQHEDFKENYGEVVFPKLPHTLAKLDPTKWRHIKTPFELISEGATMHHCVGGEGYIEDATEGNVFFHYDDGTPKGLTIELELQPFRYGWRSPALGIHLTEDGPMGYRLGQVYGVYNRDPEREAVVDINETLFATNDYGTEPEQRGNLMRSVTEAFYNRYSGVRGFNRMIWTHVSDTFEITPYTEKGKKTRDLLAGISQFLETVSGTTEYPPAVFSEATDHYARTMMTNAMYGMHAHPRVVTSDLDITTLYPTTVGGDFDGDVIIIEKLRGGSINLPWTPNNVRYETQGDERNQKIVEFLESANHTTMYTCNDKTPLMYRLMRSLLGRRVMYGFAPLDEIEYYSVLLRFRPLSIFSPTLSDNYSPKVVIKVDNAANGYWIDFFTSLDKECREEEQSRIQRNPVVSFNEPIVRNLFGYHGSII